MEDSRRTTISIVVKTPNQVREDLTVDGVCTKWTIGDLKRHLSAVYPTKPAVADQRLIFAGKLLPDHLHIEDLFRQTDPIPTLHLVCAMRNPPTASPGARPKTKEPEQLHPRQDSDALPAPSVPELRQRRPAPTPSPTAEAAAGRPAGPQMTRPAFPSYSLYSPQQLLWLQHVYAQQYYMQYHAALAAAASAPRSQVTTIGPFAPAPAHQVPVPPPIANQNPIDNLPANPNPVPDGGAFIDPGEANQNLRLNAQGGPVVEGEEEDVERDWLDYLYSAARFGVLLVIVYFNSSLSRFLLVMSTLLIMYLHTVGWFPFRRRALVQPANMVPPHPRAQQEQNRNPRADAAEEAAEPEQGQERAEAPLTAVLVPTHRVSIMWTAWVFFKTFFSSLIPDVPQGMVN